MTIFNLSPDSFEIIYVTYMKVHKVVYMTGVNSLYNAFNIDKSKYDLVLKQKINNIEYIIDVFDTSFLEKGHYTKRFNLSIQKKMKKRETLRT